MLCSRSLPNEFKVENTEQSPPLEGINDEGKGEIENRKEEELEKSIP